MPKPKSDGGPAFPSLHYSDKNEVGDEIPYAKFDGMTLRDYFAAKAMHAHAISGRNYWSASPEQTAQKAYEYADAMLEAREVKDA